jgi:hypothetical protein
MGRGATAARAAGRLPALPPSSFHRQQPAASSSCASAGPRHRAPSSRWVAARVMSADAALEEVVWEPQTLAFPAAAPGHFAPGETSFFEEHRIRGYEADDNQRATMVTIANLLQEVAGNHAVAMWGRGHGFANLPMLKGAVLVVTRLQIRMHKYPKWCAH